MNRRKTFLGILIVTLLCLLVLVYFLGHEKVFGQVQSKFTFPATRDSVSFTVIHNAGMDSCEYELKAIKCKTGDIVYKTFPRRFMVAHSFLSDSSLISLCAISKVSGRVSLYSPIQTVVFAASSSGGTIPPIIPPVIPPCALNIPPGCFGDCPPPATCADVDLWGDDYDYCGCAWPVMISSKASTACSTPSVLPATRMARRCFIAGLRRFP
jgi:hypothetical protein